MWHGTGTRRNRVMASLLAVGVVVLALTAATLVPASAAVQPPAGLHIVVSADDTQLVFAGDVDVTVLVENTGSEAIGPGRAQLTIGHEPVSSIDALFGPAPAGNRPRPVLIVRTPELEPGERVSISATIPATNLPFSPSSAPGVYGTEVRWSDRGMFSVEARSPLFRSPPFIWRSFAASGQLELATVVPVVFPEHSTPPISPGQVDEQLLRDGTVEQLIDTAERFDLTAAVDPKIVATVRAVGDAASVTAAGIVERLTRGELDTLALQYADADPVLQLTGDPGGLIDHGNLSFLTRHFRGDSFPPRGSALTSWERTLEAVAWPAPGVVSEGTLGLLADAGFSSIILSGEDASGAPRASFPSGGRGTTDVFVSNEHLERVAAQLITAATSSDRALASSQLTAVTLLLTQSHEAAEEPRQAAQAFLAIPRHAASSGASLDPLLEHLETLPWVSAIKPADLAEGSVTVHDPVDLDAQHEILRNALESEERVTAFARVLDDPSLLIDHERDRLLGLISAQRVADPAAMRAAHDVFRAYDESLLDGVQIIDTEHTRLLGESSRIPVQLRNTLPFDATIRGTVHADSPALIVQDAEISRTIIPARSTVTHLVPVTTRVSSGESSLNVHIFDVNAGEHIESQRFPISISTGIERIALGTLITIAVTLFGFGAFRSWVRHRP